MRTIKELLQVMLDNQEHFRTGLCELNICLYLRGYITCNEKCIIRNYINMHPPENIVPGIFCWYWERGEKEPRIKWLKDHIQLNS